MLSAVRALSRPSRGVASAAASAVRSYSSGHSHGEPSVGAGAKPGTIASQVEQATGLEREEYLASLQGKKYFELEPSTGKHFGTKQNPVVIFTHYGERQIGCQGPCPYAEEPGFSLWWTMKVGEDARCSECGQYFQLRPHPDAAPQAAHH